MDLPKIWVTIDEDDMQQVSVSVSLGEIDIPSCSIEELIHLKRIKILVKESLAKEGYTILNRNDSEES